MTLDINELERLHAEAVEHAAQMMAAPSYWRHTPAGQAALNAVVEHFPEIVARLKAAEEMRTAAQDVLMRSVNWSGHPGAIDRLAESKMAYDKAKG